MFVIKCGPGWYSGDNRRGDQFAALTNPAGGRKYKPEEVQAEVKRLKTLGYKPEAVELQKALESVTVSETMAKAGKAAKKARKQALKANDEQSETLPPSVELPEVDLDANIL